MAWISGSATARGSLRAYLVPLPFSILTLASARGEWHYGENWRRGSFFVLDRHKPVWSIAWSRMWSMLRKEYSTYMLTYIVTLYILWYCNCIRGWAKVSSLADFSFISTHYLLLSIGPLARNRSPRFAPLNFFSAKDRKMFTTWARLVSIQLRSLIG